MKKKDILKTTLYDAIYRVVWKQSKEVQTPEATEEIAYLVCRWLLQWDVETDYEHEERIGHILSGKSVR